MADRREWVNQSNNFNGFGGNMAGQNGGDANFSNDFDSKFVLP